MSRLSLYLLLAFLLIGSSNDAGSQVPQNLSMIELIANPDKFDGRLISVTGYLRVQFEGDALYLHQEDYLHGLTKNSLWIERSDEVVEQLESLDSNYIVIAGLFNAKNRGHMNMHSGSIRHIGKFGLWSKPNCPRSKAKAGCPAGTTPKG